MNIRQIADVKGFVTLGAGFQEAYGSFGSQLLLKGKDQYSRRSH